jgi:oligopeptide/dipeptide ABC transporter ATP-binding protein
MAPLLDVRGLTLEFPSEGGWVPVVRDLSLTVQKGEFLGLVGESGSGKSLTALAIMGLLPPAARRSGGQILLDGEDLALWNEARLRSIRGGRIGIIFQEPMTALNPVLTIGFQVAEAVRVHHSMNRRQGLEEAARLLDLVAIPDARRRLKDYPHQLSGGQRQRVMIAIALAGRPSLLLADEPTTALDVTIQAQILELLHRLRLELGLAVVLISHDLAVIAETCERVLVMYCGQVVEKAEVEELFARPAHPYTQGLLRALPVLGSGRTGEALPAIPGLVPEPRRRPSGCAFHPRCDQAWELCSEQEPALYGLAGDGASRCFLHRPAAEGVAGRAVDGATGVEETP